MGNKNNKLKKIHRNFVAKHSVHKTGAGVHEDKHGKKASRERQKKEWKNDIRSHMYEARSLEAVRLTDNQKTLLAKAIQGRVDYTNNPKLVEARNVLLDYGLITFNPQKFETFVTEKGKDKMREENLLDELGELTKEGLDFASASEENNPEDNNNPEEEIPEGLSIFKQTHFLAN